MPAVGLGSSICQGVMEWEFHDLLVPVWLHPLVSATLSRYIEVKDRQYWSRVVHESFDINRQPVNVDCIVPMSAGVRTSCASLI